MSFSLRPAVREKIGLLFGIAGASGSGKTYSALTLARGIANGTGRIAVIDTEAGRALHYAPPPSAKADGVKTFDFLHLDFQPPFTPERYIEAIRACEEAGATVIVIDSMSHEWRRRMQRHSGAGSRAHGDL
jgi:RecA/RadA recombinase